MDTDKVDSGGVQIYRLERDDAWLDRFFGETGYVRDCSGNDQRKKRYYSSNSVRILH